ncbi:MAG: ABC transporter ATP-binding protein [Planctomycetes bacterium]|nr:ABC transporter ATP-binding protein [Planctomycetota bacterium]
MAGSYFDDDLLLEGKFDRHIFVRLLLYARPHARLAAFAFALVLFATAFSLAMPALVGQIIDRLAPSAGARERIIAPFLDHRALALCYVGFELLRFVNTWLQTYLLQVLGQRVIYDVRMHLFRRLQRMPLAFFNRQPVGRLVTRLAFDVDSLTEMFSAGLVTVFMDVCLILGISVMLVVTHPRLGLIALLVLPALVTVTWVFRYFARRAYRDVARQRSILNAYMAENVNGVRVVQAFAREPVSRRGYEERNDLLLRYNLKSVTVYALFQPSFSILTAVGRSIVIGVVGLAVLRGEVSLGVFTQFFFLVSMMVEPLQDLAEKYNILQTAMASADRIFRIMDDPPDPALATPRLPAAPREARGEIEFRDARFSYVKGEEVLRGVSFAVRPGESVALVGHTGAGKSTIITLLTRFYDLDSGAVLLDGRDLRQWHPDDLRRQITVVHQDVFLFAGDIRGNIALGDAYPHAAVEQAARLAGAHDFISRLPRGYDEPVMEGGVTLSAGQRQLIGFARAILRAPPILVLDEATSNIDSRAERQIQEATARVTNGRTSIIIAHRLSTVQRCDRLIVLHHGQIAETGTHQQLLARRGIYRKLYELQFAPQAEGRRPLSAAPIPEPPAADALVPDREWAAGRD